MTDPAMRSGADDPAVISVEDLQVEFSTYGGIVKAVRGVSFNVRAGKTLAIVGESGCGKSVTVLSILGLIPMPPGRITSGHAWLDGVDIVQHRTINGEEVRGNRVGVIFQDPMSSLNPTMRVGDQIAETLVVHRGYSKQAAFQRAVELLDMTRIPEAKQRAKQYPFAFSGGMLQRAGIAMAIACEPDVLVADEPTTALDVTIQAQILELLQDLQRDNGMAILLITHDLGVVARMADDVAVMYAGEIIEKGTAEEVFYRPGPQGCDAECEAVSRYAAEAYRGLATGSVRSAGWLRLFRTLSAGDAIVRARASESFRNRAASLRELLAPSSGESEDGPGRTGYRALLRTARRGRFGFRRRPRAFRR